MSRSIDDHDADMAVRHGYGFATTPPEPRGGEGSVGQRAFEWMRDKNNAIPGTRKDTRSWADLSETDRRNFEEDAARRPSLYRDRPSSPPSGGGGWPSREEVARVMRQHLKLDRSSSIQLGNGQSVSVPGLNWLRGTDEAADAILALFPPVVGWRPIEEYEGCGPCLVSTAPESAKYLATDPVTSFRDVTGVWRCLGSEGGCAALAIQPTHFAPMPPRPALPAAPLT